MSSVYIVYILILTFNLVVGAAIILWKCHFQRDAEDCEVAVGGIIGSLVIWVLLLFVCPYVVVTTLKTAGRIRQAIEKRNPSPTQPGHYKVNLQTAFSLPRQSDVKHIKDVDAPHIVNVVNETHEKSDKTDPVTFQYICEADTAPLLKQDTDNS